MADTIHPLAQARYVQMRAQHLREFADVILQLTPSPGSPVVSEEIFRQVLRGAILDYGFEIERFIEIPIVPSTIHRWILAEYTPHSLVRRRIFEWMHKVLLEKAEEAGKFGGKKIDSRNFSPEMSRLRSALQAENDNKSSS